MNSSRHARKTIRSPGVNNLSRNIRAKLAARRENIVPGEKSTTPLIYSASTEEDIAPILDNTTGSTSSAERRITPIDGDNTTSHELDTCGNILTILHQSMVMRTPLMVWQPWDNASSIAVGLLSQVVPESFLPHRRLCPMDEAEAESEELLLLLHSVFHIRSNCPVATISPSHPLHFSNPCCNGGSSDDFCTFKK